MASVSIGRIELEMDYEQIPMCPEFLEAILTELVGNPQEGPEKEALEATRQHCLGLLDNGIVGQNWVEMSLVAAEYHSGYSAAKEVHKL